MVYRYYIRRLSINALPTEKKKEINGLSHISINLQIESEQQQQQQSPSQLAENELSKDSLVKQLIQWIFAYFKKLKGLNEAKPKRIAWHEYIFSFISSFLAILIVASIHYHLLASRDLTFLIGSLGASAVLAYAAPSSPLAQPRNFIGGNLLSALIGCLWRLSINHLDRATAAAFAVSTSIAAMQFTETVHPPGGAIALIAVITEPTLPWANFLYIFIPVLSASMIMLILALLINNLSNYRTYPVRWW